jgi:hypothetical protein
MKTKNIHKLLVTALLVLLAPGAFAYYNPSTGRWLNRDPVEEPGFRSAVLNSSSLRRETAWQEVSPHRFAANNPVNKLDLWGLSCKDPCKWARNHAGTENGITVCCGGKKYACLVFSGGSGSATDPTARGIIDTCVLEHEQVHVNDPNYLCPKQCLWKHPTLGEWANPDPATHLAGERAAYTKELDCLRNGRSQCGGNPDCEAQVDAEIDAIEKKIAHDY